MSYLKTGGERKLISKCISCVVTTIIGAAIGMTLAYFFSDSANVTSLASGAQLGGLIGLYIGVSSLVPASDLPLGRQRGIGGKD